MPEIKFSELPDHLRVKLTEEGRKELWHRVDEFGGIKALSESFEFSQSKVYNWKNKELALPVKFVKRLMGQNPTSEIVLLKGKMSSGSIENPVFPLTASDELLTRIDESVKINSDEVPVYITDEKVLVERFSELLDQLGEVNQSTYSRQSRFELRFPKFLHNLLSNLEHENYTPAEVDESGEIVDGKIKIGEKFIEAEEIRDKLYSREKTFELALQKEDSSKIADMMAEESAKVRKLTEN